MTDFPNVDPEDYEFSDDGGKGDPTGTPPADDGIIETVEIYDRLDAQIDAVFPEASVELREAAKRHTRDNHHLRTQIVARHARQLGYDPDSGMGKAIVRNFPKTEGVPTRDDVKQWAFLEYGIGESL